MQPLSAGPRSTALEPPGPTVEPGSNPDSDPEQTRVIRPRPSRGRAPAPATPPAEPAILAATPASPPPEPPAPQAHTDNTLTGTSVTESLLPAAMPLLQLLARLRTMAAQPDPAALRDRTEAELRAFETRADKTGIATDIVRRAHYALCDSLDDAVLATPWGATGAWAASPMVTVFHPSIGPGRFFDALRQAESKAGPFRPLLELMVVCLSLGMLGSYRGTPTGPAEAEARRAAAAAILAAETPPPPAELAAHWQGVDAPLHRRRARLPVWVAVAATLAIAGLFYAATLWRVNDDGDVLFTRMLETAPSHMPALTRGAPPAPPPAPPAAEPTILDRLRTTLAKPIAAGTVSIAGTPSAPLIRLPERVLFSPKVPLSSNPPTHSCNPSPPPSSRYPPASASSATATTAQSTTVLFPSAFKLSAARAQAVRTALIRTMGDKPPITAEGRLVGPTGRPGAPGPDRPRSRKPGDFPNFLCSADPSVTRVPEGWTRPAAPDRFTPVREVLRWWQRSTSSVP